MVSSSLTSAFVLPIWLQTAIVAGWLGIILLVSGLVNRFTKAGSEVVRKIVHIGTGNIILFAWWFHVPAILGITASILASALTLLSYKFPILPGINSVGRKSLGTFFYSASIGILVAWFWHIQEPHFAVIGVLIMAWGDGLAALIGQRFGKNKYKILGAQKSWEGSLAMAIASYIVCSAVLLSVQGNTLQTWVISLIVALVATALEAVSILGIDNLTVSLGSAALAFLLTNLL